MEEDGNEGKVSRLAGGIGALDMVLITLGH